LLEQKLFEKENEHLQEKPCLNDKSHFLASIKLEKQGLDVKNVVERLYTSP
jgi:hypothetical protein